MSDISFLAGFPEDVLISVLKQWLTVEQVVRLDSACCKHSQRTILLDLISKTLSPQALHVKSDTDQYVRWYAARSIHVSELTVDGDGKLSDSFESNAQQSMKSLPHVSRLRVYDADKEGRTTNWLDSVAKFCCNIRSIDLFVMTDSVEWIQRILSINVPHLKVIIIFNSNESELLAPLAAPLAECRNLEKLHLYNGETLCLDTLILNCSSLMDVRLHGCAAMTDDSFTCLLSLPLVEEINLSTNDNTTGSGEWSIVSTKLELLWLSQFSRLTEKNLVKILRTIPNKSALTVYLFGLPNISHHGTFGLKSFTQLSPNN